MREPAFFRPSAKEVKGHALCVDLDYFGIEAFGRVGCFILTKGYGGR